MKAEGGRMNKTHRGLKETVEAATECAEAVLHSVGTDLKGICYATCETETYTVSLLQRRDCS